MRKAGIMTVVTVGLALGWAMTAHAVGSYLSHLNSRYGSSYSCTVCHTTTSGAAPRNAYGQAFGSAGHSFQAIENQDSDGDGFSNLAEIQARTFPGDPNSKPTPQDTPAPTVTSFSIPSSSSSLTVPITSFTATDNVGVTGYAVTESSTAPSSGWTPSAPSRYTFSSAGTKTLYAWAKDAAGNISAPRSASVEITLNPNPPPPTPTDLIEAWVGEWLRVTLFIKKGHDWSELGLAGEGKKLEAYMNLTGWDASSNALEAMFYYEQQDEQDEEEYPEGKAFGNVPLVFEVSSVGHKEFWATSQFTDDPSTLFTARFKGKLVRGELKAGAIQSKHKHQEGQKTELWFWLKGKLIREDQLSLEILDLLLP